MNNIAKTCEIIEILNNAAPPIIMRQNLALL